MPIPKNKIIDYADLTPELARSGVFVVGMPNEDYHAYEGISSTGIKSLLRSPAHYKYNTFERTRAMEIGSAIHAAVLELEYFKEKYMLLDDVPTRQKPEYKNAVKALSSKDKDGNPTGDGSQFVFISKECDNLRGMYGAIKRNKTAMDIYQQDGYSELVGMIECPVTGVLLRIKLDRVTAETDISLDLKKCQDARAEAFTRAIGSYGYYIQAAFYCHVYKLITGCELTFKYNAIEEKAHHGCKVHTASAGSKMLGMMKVDEALPIYAECLKMEDKNSQLLERINKYRDQNTEASNKLADEMALSLVDAWPSYDDTDEEIDVPNWVMYEYEDEKSEDFDND